MCPSHCLILKLGTFLKGQVFYILSKIIVKFSIDAYETYPNSWFEACNITKFVKLHRHGLSHCSKKLDFIFCHVLCTVLRILKKAELHVNEVKWWNMLFPCFSTGLSNSRNVVFTWCITTSSPSLKWGWTWSACVASGLWAVSLTPLF